MNVWKWSESIQFRSRNDMKVWRGIPQGLRWFGLVWILCWCSTVHSFKSLRAAQAFHHPLRKTIVHGSSDDFLDEAVICVRGGTGGRGSNEFKLGRGRQQLHPFGGSGGDGGSVVLTPDATANTLRRFHRDRRFKADNGEDGAGHFSDGAKGHDLLVPVPVGTLIFDNVTSEFVGEIQDEYSRVVVAQGGRGGRGNAANVRGRGDRPMGSSPDGGGRRILRLQLKMIADIGLVGLPNAGKSTLLNSLTNAHSKIGDYSFTTVVPHLGVCSVDDYHAMVLADIPGIIANAHVGKGLGLSFLKHVERCQVLLHVVDASGVDPVSDYWTINNELFSYSQALASKPQIVVLNKVDRMADESLKRLLDSLARIMPHSRLLPVSASHKKGLSELIHRSWHFLKKVRGHSSA